jgi:hypothetical protein
MQQLASKVIFNITTEEEFTPICFTDFFLKLAFKKNKSYFSYYGNDNFCSKNNEQV